jgi:two-component system, NtrC family, sensor kinase
VIVITASTYIQNELLDLESIIKNETPITRSSFLDRIENLLNGINLVFNNTHRSSELVNQFKMVEVNQHVDALEEVKMSEFLTSISQTLQVILSPQKIQLEIVSNNCHPIYTYPSIMWQVITNICQNAAIHAFSESFVNKNLQFLVMGKQKE